MQLPFYSFLCFLASTSTFACSNFSGTYDCFGASEPLPLVITQNQQGQKYSFTTQFLGDSYMGDKIRDFTAPGSGREADGTTYLAACVDNSLQLIEEVKNREGVYMESKFIPNERGLSFLYAIVSRGNRHDVARYICQQKN